MRRGLALLAAMGLAGAVVPAGAAWPVPAGASTFPARVAADAFGANANLVFFYGGEYGTPPSDTEYAVRGRYLAAMQAAGLTVARVSATWFEIEPRAPDLVSGRHTYVWQNWDRWVSDLALHGIRWEPILGFPPDWAELCGGCQRQGAGGLDPARLKDWSAYVTAVARRYGGTATHRGDFWAAHPGLPYLPVRWYEVWNEENCSCFWSPVPDPLEYGQVYIAARDALRQVQPGAQAILGAADPTFVANMLKDHPGLAGGIDGAAVHPYYDANANYISTPLASVAAYRHALSAGGVPWRVPLYVTEIGWWTLQPYGIPDDGPDGTPNRREALVTTTDRIMRSNCNVRAYQPYTWFTPEDDPAAAWMGVAPTDAEAWYGIVNHDGTLKASAQAWAGEVRLLQGNGPVAPPAGTVTLC